MKRLHVVSDRNPSNGLFVAARLMAAQEGSAVVTCSEFLSASRFDSVPEVVVHGCWLPCYWKCCFKVLKLRAKGLAGSEGPLPLPSVRLVRMTHANLDPVRLRYHGWKKRLASPIERWLFRRCDRICVTCEAEAEWVSSWLEGAVRSGAAAKKIEVVDLKECFDLIAAGDGTPIPPAEGRPLHVLYLGRRHPLKGVSYLERAVEEVNGSAAAKIELRIVSDHAGEELERDWAWCDVLCLPTLSENFGLVVAEALARGKRVVTTDGAPAWSDLKSGRGIYLRGYRDGSSAQRVRLLRDALAGELQSVI